MSSCGFSAFSTHSHYNFIMQEFRIPSSRILTYLALRYAFWPALAAICLFFLSIALGIFVDIRWIAMSFILLCLIAPMGSAYLYFWHALKPATAYNTLPHTLSHDEVAIILRLRLSPDEEELESVGSSSEAREISERSEPNQSQYRADGASPNEKKRPKDKPAPQFREIVIPLSEIAAAEPYGDSLVLTVGPRAAKGFLFIPASEADTILKSLKL